MKETETIYEEMRSELERSTGAVVSAGGEMALRLHAVAAELSTLWAQVDWTREQSFPQTASGGMLDLHAASRGLVRAAATAAEGKLTFSIEDARSDEVPIETGTVCLNAAGLAFLTTEAGVIKAGTRSCEVKARAQTSGSAGNVPAGSITFFSLAPVGVSKCGNAHAFTGGADEEDDETLRGRVLASFESLPNGSNRAYYEAEALNTEGIGAVSVLPRARGIGTVDVVVASPSGVPAESVVAAVQERFAKQREICVDVAASAPKTVPVAVTAKITAEDGADFDTVAARVKTALETYFDGKLLGRDILLAKLGSLVFGVSGVANCSITEPTADVAIKYDQLPVAGSVTVTRR